MRIADQIALVSREFVSGNELLEAVALQEGVTNVQAASWFLRHIAELNRLPMLSFHRERSDFRHMDPPWSGDIFRDLTSSKPEGLEWDPECDGYVGGWLDSHLRKFFSETGVPFPEGITQTVPTPIARDIPSPAPTSLGTFLAAHGSDFTPLSQWLKSFGAELRRTSMALRLAIENVGGFVPLYFEQGGSDSLPQPLTSANTADIWADVLLELRSEMIPDVLSLADEGDIWVIDLFVRDVDCAAFLKLAGLSNETLQDLSGGLITYGVLDFEAAAQRERESTLRLPGSSAQSRVSAGAESDQLTVRERNGLLRIIGALLGIVSGELPNVSRHPAIASEAELIRILDQHFDGFEGLSASNLSRKFPKAKRLLRS